MEAIEYIVTQIDGDYAHLKQVEEHGTEDKLVALAMLPVEIQEGSIVIYQFLQYELKK